MNTSWIIMPIEVQRRELDAKLIVATLAATRGFQTLIGHDQMVRRMAAWLPKGILFDKSIEGERDSKVSRYHRLGYKITAMDEEATGFLMGPEAFMKIRLADKTLAKTERWFCINERVRELCVANFPDHASKFVTTGLGRTDTWRAKFAALFQKEADRIRRETGKFILFNSNFATVNHARGEAFVRKQYERMRKKDGVTGFDLEKLIAENQANLDAYVAMLPKLLEWFPDHKIVIRPHPGENIQFWKKRFEEKPGFIFSESGVVTPWILASDCLIHHGCTTGVEAELMSQPQINYAPYPDEHHDGDIPRAFSHFVHTEQELKKAVSDLIAGTGNYLMPRENLEQWFASLEGPLVAERVVDEFEKIRMPGRALSPFLPLAQFLPRNLVAQYKNLTKRSRSYSAQKYEGTSVSELQEKVNIIADALGIERAPVVSRVFKSLYRIGYEAA